MSMSRCLRALALVPALSIVLFLSAATSTQGPSSVEAIHRPLDQILDLNVRDGLVYYRALRSERGGPGRGGGVRWRQRAVARGALPGRPPWSASRGNQGAVPQEEGNGEDRPGGGPGV